MASDFGILTVSLAESEVLPGNRNSPELNFTWNFPIKTVFIVSVPVFPILFTAWVGVQLQLRGSKGAAEVTGDSLMSLSR